jgi:hypothetical protein
MAKIDWNVPYSVQKINQNITLSPVYSLHETDNMQEKLDPGNKGIRCYWKKARENLFHLLSFSDGRWRSKDETGLSLSKNRSSQNRSEFIKTFIWRFRLCTSISSALLIAGQSTRDGRFTRDVISNVLHRQLHFLARKHCRWRHALFMALLMRCRQSWCHVAQCIVMIAQRHGVLVYTLCMPMINTDTRVAM